MGTIGDAMRLAESRKTAAGLSTEGETEIAFSSGEDADRAIFSGFDIDYDELTYVVNNHGMFFMQQAVTTGLFSLFRGAWTDGFLVGLMFAKTVAPHHAPPAPDDTGAGGDNLGGIT